MNTPMNRDSIFSYRCTACGHCCYRKRIQTNPYEVLRLARNRGMSTGDFIRACLETDGPYLRVREDGSCIFLDGRVCSVHEDRPLACRTYPLGRWVSSDGKEVFRRLRLNPLPQGEYGREGTVGGFLAAQGALPYLDAADCYQSLFYRLFDTLQQELQTEAGLAGEARTSITSSGLHDMPAFMELFDIDRTVTEQCSSELVPAPNDTAETMRLHILAVDQWLETIGG